MCRNGNLCNETKILKKNTKKKKEYTKKRKTSIPVRIPKSKTEIDSEKVVRV